MRKKILFSENKKKLKLTKASKPDNSLCSGGAVALNRRVEEFDGFAGIFDGLFEVWKFQSTGSSVAVESAAVGTNNKNVLALTPIARKQGETCFGYRLPQLAQYKNYKVFPFLLLKNVVTIG